MSSNASEWCEQCQSYHPYTTPCVAKVANVDANAYAELYARHAKLQERYDELEELLRRANKIAAYAATGAESHRIKLERYKLRNERTHVPRPRGAAG